MIIGIVGCVGNGDGVMVTGINVDVGTVVGETTVWIGVTTGKAVDSLLQATRKTRRIIEKY